MLQRQRPVKRLGIPNLRRMAEAGQLDERRLRNRPLRGLCKFRIAADYQFQH
jgi:hypothetical protein